MKLVKSVNILSIAVVGLTACTETHESKVEVLPSPPKTFVRVTPAQPVLDSAPIPGFSVRLEQSKFTAGGILQRKDTVEERYEGPEGTFVIYPNGASAGRPFPRAHSKDVPPLFADGEAHTGRVVAYFRDLGLPNEQIGAAQANALMAASGVMATGEKQTRHLGFVSVVHRLFEGKRVEESYAWAQFNADDNVVAETVWWPPLPSSLLTDMAQAIDAEGSPEFRAKLPAAFAGMKGEVVIHHSPIFAQNWRVVVTIDFPRPGSSAAPFDYLGNPVELSPTEKLDSPQR